MPMHNPPHPGLTVRHDCLEPRGLSVTEGAKLLGVTRQALNNLVNGKADISPEMAVHLAKAFGSTPKMWLRLQMAYDLAKKRRKERMREQMGEWLQIYTQVKAAEKQRCKNCRELLSENEVWIKRKTVYDEEDGFADEEEEYDCTKCMNPDIST